MAGEAGEHKALIRYYFGGKRGLYNAVLKDAIEVGAGLIEPMTSTC